MDTQIIEPKVEPQHHGERRSERRHRVLKGATITFNKGYGALQCVVRNMTENGALLAFGETTGIPPQFDIKFAGSDEVRRAHICWRRPQFVGISFD